MVNNENQKSHPFGLGEKRFGWVNTYSNGNDLRTHKKIIRYTRDNLEGGIGGYVARITMENERERQRMEKNKLKNNNRNAAYNNTKYNSQRLIYPEKNTEIRKLNKKRTYGSQEKNVLHATDGRITTLLDKTPLQYQYRGKKILNVYN